MRDMGNAINRAVQDGQRQLSEQIQTSEDLIAERDMAVIKLSSQIGILTEELKIVAMALEKYEGEVIEEIETAGLGERINMALAKRVDQLKNLNKKSVMKIEIYQDKTNLYIFKILLIQPIKNFTKYAN